MKFKIPLPDSVVLTSDMFDYDSTSDLKYYAVCLGDLSDVIDYMVIDIPIERNTKVLALINREDIPAGGVVTQCSYLVLASCRRYPDVYDMHCYEYYHYSSVVPISFFSQYDFISFQDLQASFQQLYNRSRLARFSFVYPYDNIYPNNVSKVYFTTHGRVQNDFVLTNLETMMEFDERYDEPQAYNNAAQFLLAEGITRQPHDYLDNFIYNLVFVCLSNNLTQPVGVIMIEPRSYGTSIINIHIRPQYRQQALASILNNAYLDQCAIRAFNGSEIESILQRYNARPLLGIYSVG